MTHVESRKRQFAVDAGTHLIYAYNDVDTIFIKITENNVK